MDEEALYDYAYANGMYDGEGEYDEEMMMQGQDGINMGMYADDNQWCDNADLEDRLWDGAQMADMQQYQNYDEDAY